MKPGPLLRLSVACGIAMAALVVLRPEAARAVHGGLHSVTSIEPFEAIAEDGMVLRGHVYLPTGSPPFATVLEYSPYWNTFTWQSEDAAEVRGGGRVSLRSWLGPLMDAGFAVALVNVRGTGESDGCMQWGTSVDASDAAKVVETLAGKGWSNGSVGMWGLSYPGWMAYRVLSAAPSSLKAIVPVSGLIDLWSFLTRNGVPVLTAPVAITRITADTAFGAGGPPNLFIPDTAPDHFACPRYADDLLASEGTVLDGDRTPWFEERDLRSVIAQSNVAVFATNGLHACCESMILQLDGLWDLIAPRGRLMVGQWDHWFPTGSPQAATFFDKAVAFLDHHLRGGPDAAPTGVVEYQDDSGGWHTATSWPPPATETALHLSGSGTLTDDSAAVIESAQSFQSWGTPCLWHCAPAGGFFMPQPTCNVPDQAKYVSGTLGEDLVLAGNLTVELTVTSSMGDGTLAAYLWSTDAETDPDPACPEHFPTEIARSITRLRHREGTGTGRDFPVGVPTTVRLQSHPFASRIPAGRRLVLAVGGDGFDLWPNHRKPVITISTGAGHAGRVTLPVVEGEVSFAGGPD